MNPVSSVWTISHLDMLLRLVLSLILGGLVGMEREWNNHPAGFRTHILVCVGSALIMLLSIYGFTEFVSEPNVRIDPARLAAQVISGIGFLGAGAILRNGSSISGLTTAASVWVVAAIGLCVGAGFYYAAVVATVMVLVSLFLLNKWEKVLLRHRRSHEVNIKALDHPGVLGAIASKFGEQGIQIVNVRMMPDLELAESTGEKPAVRFSFKLKAKDKSKVMLAVDQIKTFDFILWMETSPGVGASGTHKTDRMQ